MGAMSAQRKPEVVGFVLRVATSGFRYRLLLRRARVALRIALFDEPARFR